MLIIFLSILLVFSAQGIVLTERNEQYYKQFEWTLKDADRLEYADAFEQGAKEIAPRLNENLKKTDSDSYYKLLWKKNYYEEEARRQRGIVAYIKESQRRYEAGAEQRRKDLEARKKEIQEDYKRQEIAHAKQQQIEAENQIRARNKRYLNNTILAIIFCGIVYALRKYSVNKKEAEEDLNN